METPSDVRFFAQYRLLTWHPRGVLDSDQMSKLLAFLEDSENSREEPFHRFSDFTLLSALQLEFEYLVHVSMHRRRAFASQEPVKAALLASDPEAVRLAKVYATLMDGSPQEVSVFTERVGAASWLGVPVEILLP
jgi:hypothetical protein